MTNSNQFSHSPPPPIILTIGAFYIWDFRDCGHHGTCSSRQIILYAWAKNAQPKKLPKNVGFRIGGATDTKYLVMQIHYAHAMQHGKKDFSGMDLVVTTQT